MSEYLKSQLVCPNCKSSLNNTADRLKCVECAEEYEIIDDIPLLRSNPDTYYGEFPQAEMVKLLADARGDLEGSLRSFLRKKDAPPRLGEYIMGMGRAGWQFILPISDQATVLDLGCGWGGIAYSLTNTCRQVVALDSTLERMQFLKLRAERDNVNNVHFVCAGDGQYLPFGDNSFDLVIINGVLEWVPSGLEGKPRELQEEFLKEVRRILKPSGSLFLGIENRYAWKTWFKNPDGHTGLRFVPWLPRWLANAYSKLKGKGDYRNYLYGRRQYERLLKKCGFGKSDFYVPFPGYHHPLAMVGVGMKSDLAQLARRHVIGAKRKVQQYIKGLLSAYFPDAFGIVSSHKPSDSFLTRLTQRIENIHGLMNSKNGHYRMNGEMGMVTVINRGSDDDSYVIKLPIHSRGEDELTGDIQFLRKIHSGTDSLSPISRYCPEVLGDGTFEKQQYGLFSLISGFSGDRIHSDGWKDAFSNAANFIAKLNDLGNSDTTCTLEERLSNLRDRVNTLTHNSSQRLAVDSAVEKVKVCFSDVPNPLRAFGHGDMKFANLVFDPETYELQGVIDWGGREYNELIGYDFQFLTVDYVRKIRNVSLPKLLKEWVDGRGDPAVVEEISSDFFNRIMTPEYKTLWPGIAAYQWLKRLSPLADKFETMRFNHRYLDDMFSVFDD